jgi:hypothetical protein
MMNRIRQSATESGRRSPCYRSKLREGETGARTVPGRTSWTRRPHPRRAPPSPGSACRHRAVMVQPSETVAGAARREPPVVRGEGSGTHRPGSRPARVFHSSPLKFRVPSTPQNLAREFLSHNQRSGLIERRLLGATQPTSIRQDPPPSLRQLRPEQCHHRLVVALGGRDVVDRRVARHPAVLRRVGLHQVINAGVGQRRFEARLHVFRE